MTSIIFCGFHQAGKTTLGKAVADNLGLSFVDIDMLIERHYERAFGKQASCREIYKQHGEMHFRAMESQELFSLDPSRQSVIALGGGTLLDLLNRQYTKLLGSVIYLKTPEDVLAQRIRANGIPAFINDSNFKAPLKNLMKKRERIYECTADYVLYNKDKTLEDQVQDIIKYSERAGAGCGI